MDIDGILHISFKVLHNSHGGRHFFFFRLSCLLFSEALEHLTSLGFLQAFLPGPRRP